MTEFREAQIERKISSAEVAASLSSRVRWYLERLDSAPDRLHLNQLADDGTPEWSRSFRRWIFGEHAVRTEVSEGSCDHPLRKDGELCQRCSIYDEQGEPMAETGRFRITRRLYVYPMRAAVARLRKVSVPDGMPPIPTLLFTLASTGSVQATIDSLMPSYPGLSDGGRAFGHFAFALRRLEEAYALEPRAGLSRRPRSEAQLDAEADPQR